MNWNKHSTFGDHMTLLAMAKLYNVQFMVLSTLGLESTSLISPLFENTHSFEIDEQIPLLFLGHSAEKDGEHYISVVPNDELNVQEFISHIRKDGNLSQVMTMSQAVPSSSTSQTISQAVPSSSTSTCQVQSNPDSLSNEMQLYSYPKVCRSKEQFAFWQRSRPWLKLSNSGSVICETCCQIKRLGIHNEQGQHNENAFLDGTVNCSSAKALLKK